MLLFGCILAYYPAKVSAATQTATITKTYLTGYYYNFSGAGINYYGQASMLQTGGTPVYCIEVKEDAYIGSNTFSDSYSRFSENQKKLIQYTLMYGYRGSTNYGYSASVEYYATQILCWIIEQDWYSDSSNSEKMVAGALSTNPDATKIRDVIGKMREQIDEHTKIPSFMSASSGSAPEYEMTYSNGTYSITLTDTNNAVSYFNWSQVTNNGISMSISGNNVTFSTTTVIADTKNIAAGKVKSKYLSSLDDVAPMYVSSSSYQDLVCDLNQRTDPIPAYMKLKTESLGHLSVSKSAEDGKLSGLQFRVQGNGVDTVITTNSNGVAQLQNILAGTYTVTEVNTPSRYVQPSSQSVTINPGRTTTASFSNTLKKFRATVTKTDAELKQAQGDATLSGAVYGMYDGSKDSLVDTFTTDENGSFTTGYYNCDDYSDGVYFQEISPSEGYLLDDTKYFLDSAPGNFTIERNTLTQGVTEQVIKGDVSIIKFMDTEDYSQTRPPEEGAVFRIYLKSAGSYDQAKDTERQTGATDENGFLSFTGLPYGTYRVEQVSGTEGHKLVDSFDVVVSEDGRTYYYLLENPVHRATVRVVKKDSETGKVIPIAGIGFQIRDSAGALVTQKINYPTPIEIDTFYTDENGMFTMPDELVYGSYTLHEVEAPYGYILGSEPIPFRVTDLNETEVIVECYNTPQKGKVVLEKTGRVPISSQENTDGTTSVQFETRGLAGAEYTIRALEDIIIGGDLKYSAGDTVGTLVTDADGKAELSGLYIGVYEAEETKAPEGFVLNASKQTFAITYAGQEAQIAETVTVSFHNDRQEAVVKFRKQLETDELTGVGSGDEALSVVFGLFAGEDIRDVQGKVIVPADTLLAVSGINRYGYGSFSLEIPGSYYLMELERDEHYQEHTQRYPVQFDYAGQHTECVYITANEGQTIQNELIRGDIQGQKYGEGDNPPYTDELPNALFGLFYPDEWLFTEDNALLTCLTDDTGRFAFEGIVYGDYLVREIEPPKGMFCQRRSTR